MGVIVIYIIIKLFTRTFTNQKEAKAFDIFYCQKLKGLIKVITNYKLRLIKDKNRLTQKKVMKLIKIHN